MPSLSSIDGLGEKAADAVVDASKDGKFLSREDFRNGQRSVRLFVILWEIWDFWGSSRIQSAVSF